MTPEAIQRLIRAEIAAALRLLSEEFRRDGLREDHLIAHQIEIAAERYERRSNDQQV